MSMSYHVCTTTCIHTHNPYTFITESPPSYFQMPISDYNNPDETSRVLETFFQPYMQEEEYNRLRKSFGLPVILEGEVIDEWFE